MPTEAPKIRFHQFTGKYTQIPDPRPPKQGEPAAVVAKMIDDKPIFNIYEGRLRGPFRVIKPARFVQKNGVNECIDNGTLEYTNDFYEITRPMGSGFRNQAIKSWHLDVNFGTEYMERWGYVEHGLLEADAKALHGNRNWFEFVEPEVVAATPAPVIPVTEKPAQKGK